jgi:hypothetical protein
MGTVEPDLHHRTPHAIINDPSALSHLSPGRWPALHANLVKLCGQRGVFRSAEMITALSFNSTPSTGKPASSLVAKVRDAEGCLSTPKRVSPNPSSRPHGQLPYSRQSNVGKQKTLESAH